MRRLPGGRTRTDADVCAPAGLLLELYSRAIQDLDVKEAFETLCKYDRHADYCKKCRKVGGMTIGEGMP